jgi:PAS domain S-box-containing protein
MNTEIEEQRSSDEDQRACERRFRMIVDDLPVLIAIMTPAGEVAFVNRRVIEYFGATLEELKRWERFIHPDDRLSVIAAWGQSVQAGQPYDTEARQRRADGMYRWFHIRGFPVRDAEGRVVLWHVLQTDVDDGRRAEGLLAGEKRLLEMVATAHPLSMVLEGLCKLVEHTADGCCCSILFVDPSVTRFQYAAAHNLPAGYDESMDGSPAHCEASPCGMAAFLKTQVIVQDVALDMRWEVNGWRNLAVSHGLRSCWSTPILSRTQIVFGTFAIYQREPGNPSAFQHEVIGRIAHIASIAIERAQNDAALKRSEEFLAQAQQVSSTGGFYWHVATDELTWSEQVYRIFELDPAVPVTLERIGTRLHPEDIPSFDAMLKRQRSHACDFEHDHRLRMPDGSLKYLHVVAHATQDTNGQLVYVAAVQDVTERRLSEEALGQVRAELAHVARVTSLGALTASIAHEVNQPLSGIITNASTCLRMLAADPPNIDGACETARRTIRDANRAADVITRLRALFGKKSATMEYVDLNEATREVIALSLSELQRNRVILQTVFADLPPVLGDRVQLQQVILNLVLNASDALSGIHDRARRLMITTGEDERDQVRLTVQDAGVGFEPQSVDRLFEAFYTTKSNGMGMGLSVSRSIIESHHGRIWAQQNDGPGAKFSFAIPRRPQVVRGGRTVILAPTTMQTYAATDAQHPLGSA